MTESLLLVGVIIAACILLSGFAEKLPVPSLLIFIGLGMLFGENGPPFCNQLIVFLQPPDMPCDACLAHASRQLGQSVPPIGDISQYGKIVPVLLPELLNQQGIPLIDKGRVGLRHAVNHAVCVRTTLLHKQIHILRHSARERVQGKQILVRVINIHRSNFRLDSFKCCSENYIRTLFKNIATYKFSQKLNIIKKLIRFCLLLWQQARKARFPRRLSPRNSRKIYRFP